MPQRPPHACAGCGVATSEKGRCASCRSKRNRDIDARRSLDSREFYTSRRWHALRHVVLDREVLCRECASMGTTTVAREVDHIVPRESGGPDTVANLQPLCSTCHSRKTMRELNARRLA